MGYGERHGGRAIPVEAKTIAQSLPKSLHMRDAILTAAPLAGRNSCTVLTPYGEITDKTYAATFFETTWRLCLS